MKPRSALVERLTAIAEVLTVLILGNLLARSILRRAFTPDFLGTSYNPSEGNALSAAEVATVSLVLRFGILLILGFGLLWWRERRPPTRAGITTGEVPLAALVRYGVVLFAVASLPWKVVGLLNTLWPFGSGLAGWDDVRAGGWHVDVVLLVLARAVLLPPLLEEPLVRGYMLTRLRTGGWGIVGGVLLSATIFEFSHGHFYQADWAVFALFISGWIAAACWAYATVKTGSIVPAVVAHALGNLPDPVSSAHQALVLGSMGLIVFIFRRQVRSGIRDFVEDLRIQPGKKVLALAVLGTAGVMAASALYRPFLALLGAVAFLTLILTARREPASAL
jgi:membrane protease YdiL (CAAX protease family)